MNIANWIFGLYSKPKTFSKQNIKIEKMQIGFNKSTIMNTLGYSTLMLIKNKPGKERSNLISPMCYVSNDRW